MNSPQKKIKTHPTPGGPCGVLGGGGKNSKVREMSWTARESIIIFKPPSHAVVGSFRAQHFQKGGREEGRAGGREGGGRWKEGGQRGWE